MKVISILQPWATLIVIGAKRIETRSWNTKHRGDLLIHASKRWDNKLYQSILDIGAEQILDDAGYKLTRIKNGKVFTNLPLGSIIGKVNLRDTSDMVTLNAFNYAWGNYCITPEEKSFGDYSPGRFGWLLSDPEQFKTPIPAKGNLSLWDYDIKL